MAVINHPRQGEPATVGGGGTIYTIACGGRAPAPMPNYTLDVGAKVHITYDFSADLPEEPDAVVDSAAVDPATRDWVFIMQVDPILQFGRQHIFMIWFHYLSNTAGDPPVDRLFTSVFVPDAVTVWKRLIAYIRAQAQGQAQPQAKKKKASKPSKKSRRNKK